MHKTSAKFQNYQKKTVRGIVPTRYPLSIHFNSISCQKRLSSQSRKHEKNNQSIIPKPHAHLHSMLKTSAMFQNNWWKTVRGVAPTRYPLSIHFDSISYRKKTKFTKQKSEKKQSKDYIRTTRTSSFHAENI